MSKKNINPFKVGDRIIRIKKGIFNSVVEFNQGKILTIKAIKTSYSITIVEEIHRLDGTQLPDDYEYSLENFEHAEKLIIINKEEYI